MAPPAGGTLACRPQHFEAVVHFCLGCCRACRLLLRLCRQAGRTVGWQAGGQAGWQAGRKAGCCCGEPAYALDSERSQAAGPLSLVVPARRRQADGAKHSAPCRRDCQQLCKQVPTAANWTGIQAPSPPACRARCPSIRPGASGQATPGWPHSRRTKTHAAATTSTLWGVSRPVKQNHQGGSPVARAQQRAQGGGGGGGGEGLPT